MEVLGRRLHDHAAGADRRDPRAISQVAARYSARAHRHDAQHLRAAAAEAVRDSSRRRPTAATASRSRAARTPIRRWPRPACGPLRPTLRATPSRSSSRSIGKANHVLSADMTRQMLTPGMGHWGLGLEIGGADANPYFSHGGVNEGFVNHFARLLRRTAMARW